MLRDVYKMEGWRALFKGLGPNLSGVVPARYDQTGRPIMRFSSSNYLKLDPSTSIPMVMARS